VRRVLCRTTTIVGGRHCIAIIRHLDVTRPRAAVTGHLPPGLLPQKYHCEHLPLPVTVSLRVIDGAHTVCLSNGRMSVRPLACLSRRSTSAACHSLAPAPRTDYISTIAADAPAADSDSVMLRAEGRGSTQRLFAHSLG